MQKKETVVVEAINRYLVQNSSASDRRFAIFFEPILIAQELNFFTYTCRGLDRAPHQIEILIGENNTISSLCSCGKNHKKMCTPQIAALQNLINLVEKGEVRDGFKPGTVLRKDTVIPTIQGVIDVHAANQIQFSRKAYYYSPLELEELDRNHVSYHLYDLGKYLKVSLNFNETEQELLAKCTCSSVHPCYHKGLVLEDFLKKFGAHYFSTSYFDKLKADYIEKNQIDPGLDFDDLFTLTVGKTGLKYEAKIHNLVKAHQSPINLLNLDQLEGLNLPTDRENFGLGFCFVMERKQLVAFSPFVGKRNKDGSELHSKFTRIDLQNLFEQKDNLFQSGDFDVLLAAMGFSKDFRYSKWQNWEKEKFEALLARFVPFIKEKGGRYPFFLYDLKHTFVKKNVSQIKVSVGTPKPIVRINESEKFFNIQMKLRVNGSMLGIQSNKIIVSPLGLLCGDEFLVFPDATTALVFARALAYQELNVIKAPDLDLRKQFIDPLSKFFEIEVTGLKLAKGKNEQLDFERHLYLSDEGSEYIVLRPLVKYGDQLMIPTSEEKLWTNESGYEFFERQMDQENDFLDFVRDLHPDFEGMGSYFYLHASRALENLWLMDAIDKLAKQNVTVFGMNALKKIPYNLNKPSFSMMLSSNTDWFDMKMDVSFGDQKADLRDIQKALLKRQNYVELKDGRLGLLPSEWIDKYKKYFKLGQVKKDQLEISNYQFSLIDELFEDMTNVPNFLQELYEKKKRLANLKEMLDIPKPKGLKAELRPYQQQGLNWLVFLEENQLGGCLADDMGLGKTLQTIAFLQHLKNQQSKTQLTNLVVAPTSLMFNWKAELKKFAPKLSVLVYTGANREELKDQIMNHDVVLTTYGSLINDITLHQNNEYYYAILDESQAIKNPDSQRYKAVRLIRAKNRLVLTGTPIENNTFDLYSQFNFLNPGFFGSVKHFKATFSDAIDKEQDKESSLLLAKMINPFLLRRTKDQVATELPPKTEAFIYCEMGPEQRKVYDYFKAYYREQIRKQIAEEGINKSQMYILQGLTKLRQICNSTELADAERDFGSYSAKLDELVHHLKEKVSKHKVLIFSQFVGMLQIIQRRLEEENITFEYLDGQTRKREEKVNNFQSDDSIRVFLISLKAGGTGLNLTEADYVYLVDPWWNPAVENQAIDRCYRIGQNKNVMAYRMICTDTIEEKIVQLQERKLTIASEVIRTDIDKKSFNMKEVEHLFA